jgi:thioredoxin-dependent peroxiredoxin
LGIIVDGSKGEKVKIEMKKIQAGLVWAVIAIVILVSASKASSRTLISAADRDTPPAVGEKVADFSLASVDGKQLSLSAELRKGPVVLVLLRGWPGYQCPFCTRQFGDFLAHAKDLQDSGARVIMVYPGPGENLKQHVDEFIANRELLPNFHILLDPDFAFTRSLALRWDAPKETSYPSTFVIDQSGTVQYALISKTHSGRATADDVLKVLSTLRK